MARAATHRLSPSLVALGRGLDARDVSRLRGFLRRAVTWQESLRGFPRLASAPDGTPYVSLYAKGTLRGCFGSAEGSPAERVARAFLLALSDVRYGGIEAGERATLAAEVSYVTRARPLRADAIEAALEPGVHGLALVSPESTTLLLPSVARERGQDAAQMLELIARKAGVARPEEGLVWLLETESVSTHGALARDPERAARRWLESLVPPSRAMAFDMDPGTGALGADGTMRHGRIAVAIEALTALGSAMAEPARRWLAREIAHALAGQVVLGWPAPKDMVLGTLALAARAGVRVPLAEFAASLDPEATSPWHAAQAASVLGPLTPPRLWERCVRSLEARPFAPYAVMAARTVGDARVLERAVRAVVDSIRTCTPFRGGAGVTPIPETALTAAAVEALAPIGGRDVKRAVALGRAFLSERQILDVPASMHPRALGAFRASPVAPVLRCDVTAHAALALFAGD